MVCPRHNQTVTGSSLTHATVIACLQICLIWNCVCCTAADDPGMTQIVCLGYPIKSHSRGREREKAARCKAQKQLSECQTELIPAFTKRFTFPKLSHRYNVSLIQEYFPAALIQITFIADIESVQIFQIPALLTQIRWILYWVKPHKSWLFIQLFLLKQSMLWIN